MQARKTGKAFAKLTQSVYVYEITVHHGGFEYELEVDSSTGRVRIADIDD